MIPCGGLFGDEENPFLLPGTDPRFHLLQARSLVNLPTALALLPTQRFAVNWQFEAVLFYWQTILSELYNFKVTCSNN